MRLIDADDLRVFTRNGESEEFMEGVKWALEFLTKNAPTAYDVEAVVAELEAKRKGYEEAGKVFNGTHGSGIRLSYALKQGAILEAMEIVRNGGKE